MYMYSYIYKHMHMYTFFPTISYFLTHSFIYQCIDRVCWLWCRILKTLIWPLSIIRIQNLASKLKNFFSLVVNVPCNSSGETKWVGGVTIAVHLSGPCQLLLASIPFPFFFPVTWLVAECHEYIWGRWWVISWMGKMNWEIYLLSMVNTAVFCLHPLVRRYQ